MSHTKDKVYFITVKTLDAALRLQYKLRKLTTHTTHVSTIIKNFPMYSLPLQLEIVVRGGTLLHIAPNYRKICKVGVFK